jgi:NTE family protein
MDAPADKLALVMGGGGARAAYQVGVLKAIARRAPKLAIPILTGVSAGAINTAFLASRTGDLDQRIERLEELWLSLTVDKVFQSDSFSLLRTASRWGVRLISGSSRLTPRPRGMVDTQPLREFLRVALDAPDDRMLGIRDNLKSGGLHAVAITTTEYSTGHSVTHVQSNGAPSWRRPNRYSVETQIGVEHVMASSALPMFFPAVKVGETWHGDGGVGLTAPLSPPLRLGAERILAISTRFDRTHPDPEPIAKTYPPPAQIIGLLMKAVFLDMLDQDAMNLDRINQLVEVLPPEKRMGLRPARLLLLRPSRNISSLAGRYEPNLPQPFKFLMRGTGTRETKSPESLSMVMFEPTYVREVITMGEEDAEKRMPEILAFLQGETLPGLQVTGFWRV